MEWIIFRLKSRSDYLDYFLPFPFLFGAPRNCENAIEKH